MTEDYQAYKLASRANELAILMNERLFIVEREIDALVEINKILKNRILALENKNDR